MDWDAYSPDVGRTTDSHLNAEQVVSIRQVLNMEFKRELLVRVGGCTAMCS